MAGTTRTISLVEPVGDLLRSQGSARDVRRVVVLEDLRVSAARVPEGAPVTLELRLESLNEGIVASGSVSAPFLAECRRCLAEVTGEIRAAVMEVFEEEPVEGETQPLVAGTVDLEPVAREAVLLELPLAPLCRAACEGLCSSCGADRNAGDCGCTTEVADPRWAALDALRLDDDA